MGKKKFPKPTQSEQPKAASEPGQPQPSANPQRQPQPHHEQPKPSSSQQHQRPEQGHAASGDDPRGQQQKQQKAGKFKQNVQGQHTQMHQEMQKLSVEGGSQHVRGPPFPGVQMPLHPAQMRSEPPASSIPSLMSVPLSTPQHFAPGQQGARQWGPPQPRPAVPPFSRQQSPGSPSHVPPGYYPGSQGIPQQQQRQQQFPPASPAHIPQGVPPVASGFPKQEPPQGISAPLTSQPQVAGEQAKKRRGRQTKDAGEKVAAPAPKDQPAKGIPPAQKVPSASKQPGKAPPPQQQQQRHESPPLDFIVPLRKKLKSGGTKGRKILIETNHLALTLKNLKPAIHYDVAIDPDKPKKLLRIVMEQFRRQHYNNRYPAFDGVKNLYSSTLLPFGHEIFGEITIQEDDRDKTFKVAVKFANEVDLSSLSRYFESAASGNIHMVTPQEAIQCLDIVLRNAPSLHCIPVGRSFFTRPPREMDLGEGMEMYHGFYQSAILGWKPFLNIDVSHKAFPKVMSVLDLIRELCGSNYNLMEPLRYQNYEEVDKYMRSLKVQYQIPNQPSSKRVMRVNQLDQPAKDARFKTDNNIEMSVADYFARVKNIPLRYPHLPCLWVGSKQRDTRILLPPEFCTILEGQVTNRTMTANQTSAMIRIAATSTAERKEKIMRSIKAANFSKDNCAREFGISINEEFTKVQARVLDPPILKYAVRTVHPQRGVWRAEKFSRTGTLQKWTIVCVDDRTRPQALQEFAETMIQQGRPLGMEISRPEIKSIRLIRNKEKAMLEQEFSKLKNNDLILVVIPDMPKEIYNYVKQAAELTVGVVTQCVKGKNVFRPKPSTLGNILLKVNAKLNGLNHGLVQTPACLTRPCMIMGADVTHPSPESRGTVPSVAAVTASHDSYAFKYNITWRLQKSTQEIITDLANIVKEHLIYFLKVNKVKPERIIFFRDGVSEGQFEIVVSSEVQAVRQACRMVDATGAYKPKLTFLVVQKRHHTRFFPTNPRDSEDKNCNVPAGTVVDTEITHPTALDFYLVSHASIQGVARPTKYRKLWDDNDMQEDELEELTYHLCHLFTRCTRSVSYPAPTYYAHLAAARAKVYCDRRNLNMEDLDREQARLQIKTEVVKEFPMFFV